MQTIDVEVTKVVAAHGVEPIDTTAPEPKLVPVTVTGVCPIYKPFAGRTVSIVGSSKLKAFRPVPTSELTVKATCWALPVPATDAQRNDVDDTKDETAQSAPPRLDAAASAAVPKFCPEIVTTAPPAVGPLDGENAVRTGMSPWKSLPPSSDSAAETVSETGNACPDVRTGVVQSTAESDTHAVEEHKDGPIATVRETSRLAKFTPITVTSAPAMGPLVDDKWLRTGASYENRATLVPTMPVSTMLTW